MVLVVWFDVVDVDVRCGKVVFVFVGKSSSAVGCCVETVPGNQKAWYWSTKVKSFVE